MGDDGSKVKCATTILKDSAHPQLRVRWCYCQDAYLLDIHDSWRFFDVKSTATLSSPSYSLVGSSDPGRVPSCREQLCRCPISHTVVARLNTGTCSVRINRGTCPIRINKQVAIGKHDHCDARLLPSMRNQDEKMGEGQSEYPGNVRWKNVLLSQQ